MRIMGLLSVVLVLAVVFVVGQKQIGASHLAAPAALPSQPERGVAPMQQVQPVIDGVMQGRTQDLEQRMSQP